MFNDRRKMKGSNRMVTSGMTQNPLVPGKFKAPQYRNRLGAFLTGSNTTMPKNALIFGEGPGQSTKLGQMHERRGNTFTTNQEYFNQNAQNPKRLGK